MDSNTRNSPVTQRKYLRIIPFQSDRFKQKNTRVKVSYALNLPIDWLIDYLMYISCAGWLFDLITSAYVFLFYIFRWELEWPDCLQHSQPETGKASEQNPSPAAPQSPFRQQDKSQKYSTENRHARGLSVRINGLLDITFEGKNEKKISHVYFAFNLHISSAHWCEFIVILAVFKYFLFFYSEFYWIDKFKKKLLQIMINIFYFLFE